MAWFCKNCETLNEDYDNSCVVCNSLAPIISGITFSYNKKEGVGVLSWKEEYTERIILRYAKKQYDVTGKSSLQIEPNCNDPIVLVAVNAAAEREYAFTISSSIIQDAIDFHKNKNELNSWRAACRKKSYEGYQFYLFEYPLGKYADEARKRASECKRAEIEAQKLLALKAEDDAWAEACRVHSTYAYSSFLKKYPAGKYKDAASRELKVFMEAEDWRKAKASNTIPSLESFIRKYPDSPHIAEAKDIISCIRAKNEEDRAWKTAMDYNTKESYKEYLAKYPDGRYALAAQKKIEELKGDYRPAVIVLLSIVVTIIILAIIVAQNNNTSAPSHTSPPVRKEQAQQKPVQRQQQQPMYTLSQSQINDLENQTDRLIKGMEVAKQVGDKIDPNNRRKVQQNLETLRKNGSKKHPKLKARYDAL